MDCLFFCPRWGSEALSWADFCARVKQSGYDGIEAGVPFDEVEKSEMKDALEQNNLLLIGQYWQSFEKDFDAHKFSYLRHLENMRSLNPIKIDAQTGKDYFSFEKNRQLFHLAASFTASSNIVVAHETHRNKALFAAHVTKSYLEDEPGLNITADFSHWCAVAESYLDDQQEALNIAIEHAVHIHARVGHTQGPQVTDPRLEEWQDALRHHLKWWKKIVAVNRKNNQSHISITPEFGPAPYMLHHPFTKEPLASQWDINLWMMKYLKENLI